MTDKTMAISLQHMIAASLAGWQQHLDRLQAKRDKLQEELRATDIEMAHHILNKKNLELHAKSLAVHAADSWQGENKGQPEVKG